jgi:predicted amidohydrolase YtcJ
VDEQTFVNGKIFTGRSEHDFVSTFKVADGRITWTGDASDVADAEAIDLAGKTVLPGFIDIHTHPSYVAMTVNAVPCTVPVVNNIPEMIEALKKHPNFGKGERAWIEGWGYDESKLAEHRTPTAEDLDRVSTTQPVYVMRSDCHSGICDTRALEIAGITRDTPDPEGARFGRYENGEPNGVLQEHAANNVVIRTKSSQDYQARVGAI